MPSEFKQNAPAVILFVFFTVLYIYTAAPGVYDGDSGEIAAAVNTLGLAHPTGFPLYMLTGKLFTLLMPVKDVAYRLNIFSALLTAGALVFIYYALRNLGNSPFASLVALFVLGLGRNTIWRNSGNANVYTISLLLASALMLILSKWSKERKIKYLYLYGFIWGLSLGSHSIMVIMGAPFLLMLWLSREELKEKISVIAKTVLVTIFPTIQYIYLPLAYKGNSMVNWGSMSTFNDFVYYITQRQYGNKIFSRTFSETLDFFEKTLGLLTTEFTIIFFSLTILGLITLYKKNKILLAAIIMVIMMNLGMLLAYGKWEVDLLILPRYLFISYSVLTIGLAVGLDKITTWVKTKKMQKRQYF